MQLRKYHILKLLIMCRNKQNPLLDSLSSFLIGVLSLVLGFQLLLSFLLNDITAENR